MLSDHPKLPKFAFYTESVKIVYMLKFGKLFLKVKRMNTFKMLFTFKSNC